MARLPTTSTAPGLAVPPVPLLPFAAVALVSLPSLPLATLLLVPPTGLLFAPVRLIGLALGRRSLVPLLEEALLSGTRAELRVHHVTEPAAPDLL